jgi:hypothetical protein
LRDPDLADVLSKHRDRGLGIGLLDLEPFGVTAAAEDFLSRRTGVANPARLPVAGDEPPLAVDVYEIDGRRVFAI